MERYSHCNSQSCIYNILCHRSGTPLKSSTNIELITAKKPSLRSKQTEHPILSYLSWSIFTDLQISKDWPIRLLRSHNYHLHIDYSYIPDAFQNSQTVWLQHNWLIKNRNVFYHISLVLLCADYAYRCRQIDSLRCAQLHGDKYFTLARAAYTWASDKKSITAESLLCNRVT